MIKTEFWEKVAFSWSKIDKTDIVPIDDDEAIPDDFFEENEIENIDDYLRGLIGGDIESENEEIDVTAFYS